MLNAVPDIEVVAEAASGPEAVVIAGRCEPDVILMDLKMSAGGGVDAISALGPGHRVIVLTAFSDTEEIRRALDAGALGCLLKDVSVAELAAAIRQAAAGQQVVSAPLAAPVIVDGEGAGLSGREREVLSLVSCGKTNVEIGAQLFIGEATVKTYLARVFAKLDVEDRTSAVVEGLRRGLIERVQPPAG